MAGRAPVPTEDAWAEAVRTAEDEATSQVALRRFRTFRELEAYVQSVVLSRWWSECFPAAPLEVEVVRRGRSATFSAAEQPASGFAVVHIVDGRGWGLETVLHELAHLAAGVRAGHGERFTRALRSLWRHEAGVEAWAAIEAALERSTPPS